MLNLATEEQAEEIYKHFYNNRTWFPHIRKDYVFRNVKAGNVVYHDGVIIIFKRYTRKQALGSTLDGVATIQAQKDDVMLHQILNTSEGSGKASDVIEKFFVFVESPRIWLSVRADNARACSFYRRVGMQEVGKTSWKKGTMKGKVFLKEEISHLDFLGTK